MLEIEIDESEVVGLIAAVTDGGTVLSVGDGIEWSTGLVSLD